VYIQNNHCHRVTTQLQLINIIIIIIITFMFFIFFQLFIHTSTDTLYEHVSRDALPMDYGGSLASIETYHS